MPKLKEGEAGRVAFQGIIQNITTKISATGDKEGRLIINFRPEDDIMEVLNRLQRPDKEIFVVIMDKE